MLRRCLEETENALCLVTKSVDTICVYVDDKTGGAGVFFCYHMSNHRPTVFNVFMTLY